MSRTMLVGLVLFAFAAAGLGATRAVVARRHAHYSYKYEYVKHTFGRRAIAGSAGFAAFGTLRNRPHEWGRGGAGFGKRLASGFATHLVDNSIRYGVGSIRHEDLDYHRSEKRGFGARLKHALVSTVVTHKRTTGKRMVAAGNISGAFGSGVISRAWQPASTGSLASGIGTGGLILGARAGTNVAREFWPRHHHRVYAYRRTVAYRRG